MSRHPSHLRRQTPSPVLVVTAALVFLGIPSTAGGAPKVEPSRRDVSTQEELHQVKQARTFVDPAATSSVVAPPLRKAAFPEP